ncbi:MAG: aminotransferase class V-fold PLP-dependent enzyme [Saprospiraceae bacterium]|nr:aminotransferase class V-fold PLP-dependent enzyme [Saprospiraceae bacterium]
MKTQFLLDPEVAYLNHGSFGACPKPIFDNFQHWQRELEREPVQFITKTAVKALEDAKHALAPFIGCRPEDFFFTQNPTAAINQIVRSLDLGPGDEVLTTNHEYGAMDRTWRFYALKKGYRYVQQDIPLPVQSKEQILDAFWKGLTPNTRVVFLSHMTSATALIFPVQEICEKAKSLGLISIVDGAHVPGHIPLDIGSLQPDYYTGTLHKWMLAPKGSSFLYVARQHQETLDPLIVSWGYESEAPSGNTFLDYNEIQGTRDIAAFLCTPAVMQFLQENQWADVSRRCKDAIRQHYPAFCDLLDTRPICPLSDAFLGQMCSIPIQTPNPVALKEALWERYSIEIPVMKRGNDYLLRISMQGYNSESDLDRLRAALLELRQDSDLLA